MLPVEIVEHVVSFVDAFPAPYRVAALRCCALLAREWTPTARKALFFQLVYKGRGAKDRRLAFLRDTPQCAMWVLALQIHVTGNAQEEPTLRQLPSVLPNVETVYVMPSSADAQRRFSELPILDILGVFPRLRSLQMFFNEPVCPHAPQFPAEVGIEALAMRTPSQWQLRVLEALARTETLRTLRRVTLSTDLEKDQGAPALYSEAVEVLERFPALEFLDLGPINTADADDSPSPPAVNATPDQGLLAQPIASFAHLTRFALEPEAISWTWIVPNTASLLFDLLAPLHLPALRFIDVSITKFCMPLRAAPRTGAGRPAAAHDLVPLFGSVEGEPAHGLAVHEILPRALAGTLERLTLSFRSHSPRAVVVLDGQRFLARLGPAFRARVHFEAAGGHEIVLE